VVLSFPPTDNPAAEEVPIPLLLYVPLGKSPVSVHDVPSHDSVIALPKGGPPAKAKPEVKTPKLPKFLLGVFPSLTSVQEVPSYVSVLSVSEG